MSLGNMGTYRLCLGKEADCLLLLLNLISCTDKKKKSLTTSPQRLSIAGCSSVSLLMIWNLKKKAKQGKNITNQGMYLKRMFFVNIYSYSILF